MWNVYERKEINMKRKLVLITSALMTIALLAGCNQKSHTHEWGEATYTWNTEYTECTAKAICQADSSHVLEETKKAVAGGIEGTDGTVQYGNLAKFDSEVFSNQVYALYTLTPREQGTEYSVKSIGSSVVKGAITIPSSFNDIPVTLTDAQGFSNHNGITSVKIPSSIITIGMNAFLFCSNLTELTFESASKVKTICSTAFAETAIKSLTIPASVETIEEYAFGECNHSIKSLTFEAGSKLVTIGDSAFSMTRCETLVLPDGLKTIGEDAFSDNAIKSLTLPASIESIGSGAFQGLIADEINYKGTKNQWSEISYESTSFDGKELTVHCSDGDVYLSTQQY